MNYKLFLRLLTAPFVFYEDNENYSEKIKNLIPTLDEKQNLALYTHVWGKESYNPENKPDIIDCLHKIACLALCQNGGHLVYEYDGWRKKIKSSYTLFADEINNEENFKKIEFSLARFFPEELLAAARGSTGKHYKIGYNIRYLEILRNFGDFHLHKGAAFSFCRLIPVILKKEDFDSMRRTVGFLDSNKEIGINYIGVLIKTWLAAYAILSHHLISRTENRLQLSDIPEMFKEVDSLSSKNFEDWDHFFANNLLFDISNDQLHKINPKQLSGKFIPMEDVLSNCFGSNGNPRVCGKNEDLDKIINIWLHSLIKFYQKITHQENKPGLHAFKKFFTSVDISKELLQDEITLSDMISDISPNGKLQYLELRFCLHQDTKTIPGRLEKIVDSYKKWLESDDISKDIEICFTPSLVKNLPKSSSNNEKIYSKLLNNYISQVGALNIKLKENETWYYLFRGLDCCNLERSVPNWIIGWVYNIYKAYIQAPIDRNEKRTSRCTIHAGEDYIWPIQGLRYIDECLHFLDDKDRIGHAIALGIEYTEWLENKTILRTNYRDLLDDLYWILSVTSDEETKKKLEKCVNTYRTKAKNEIIDIPNELSEDNVEYLVQAYTMRYKYEEIENMQIQELNEGIFIDKIEDSSREKFEKLYVDYLHNGFKLSEKGVIVSHEILEVCQKIFPKLQEYVLSKIKKKRICIEICPTSNILVGALAPDFSQHPFFKIPLGIPCSINSDDPIIFATNSEKEYVYILDAIDEKHPNKWADFCNRIERSYSYRFHHDDHSEVKSAFPIHTVPE